MTLKQFPQINRIITASFFTTLSIGALAIIMILNFHTQLFPENEEYTRLKIQTLLTPQSTLPLTDLGSYFNSYGLPEEALHYYQIAQTLYNNQGAQNSKVLGIQSPFVMYQEILNKRKKELDELNYWKKITKEFPEYRDGYLQLGRCYYQLGEFYEAKKAISIAWEIDPRYPDKEKYRFITSI